MHEGLSGFGGSAQSQLTSLLGTTFGQGLSSLTKGALGHAAVMGGGQLRSPGGLSICCGQLASMHQFAPALQL